MVNIEILMFDVQSYTAKQEMITVALHNSVLYKLALIPQK